VPDVHRPKSAHARRIRLAGEVADPANPPSGCHFHPRCPSASDRCRTEAPALRRIAGSGEVACHHAEEIAATSPAIPFAQPAISQEGTKLWTTV
jgi:peptide/nickel transport system ATP-binding protein